MIQLSRFRLVELQLPLKITLYRDACIFISLKNTREIWHMYRRLSVNFRFNNGRSNLDNKALKDIQRVADFLAKPENKGRKLYLVGFSDANARVEHDFLIARFRALLVQAKLMNKKIAVFSSYSLGSFMPVASQGSHIATLKNGRAEVWLERLTPMVASL